MMNVRPSRLVRLAMLAGLAAMLQLGPVYWPGPGYLLAMATSLPVALGVALWPKRSTWFFFVIALLLGIASVQEMLIFIATTGPLGLMLGLTARRPAWQAVLVAGFTLTGGMLLLPYLAGVQPWGDGALPWQGWAIVALDLGFALLYAALWRLLFQQVWSRLQPTLRYTGKDDTQRSCPP